MEVEVIDFAPIGSDERGVTKKFSIKDYGQFVFLTRKAGSISGNTYHEGKNIGTKEKTFVLISGKVKLLYRLHGTSEIKEQIIDEHKVIKVFPNVVHKMEALTDIIILENNSIEDIANDCIREAV
ncbi:hypothetical protein [Zooshikella ganghwensis]|uniref:polysaccharide biosynthesis C-terminal domain-containing protein n=1 Tax=Zooshikella ganghwensis TaxID=202772 RepID=UPI00042A1314|nr:hypothetical protein [Zooshikella ganghwensis]